MFSRSSVDVCNVFDEIPYDTAMVNIHLCEYIVNKKRACTKMRWA